MYWKRIVGRRERGREDLISVGMLGRVFSYVGEWESEGEASGLLKGIARICFFEWITPSKVGIRDSEIYLSMDE